MQDRSTEATTREARRPRDPNRGAWRMIVVTTFMALLAYGVTAVALRATAQPQEPPPATTPGPGPAAPAPAPEAPAPAAGAPASVSKEEAAKEDPDLQEETTRRANAPTLADELPPDLRESADNNLSFPVDI
jgi:hypothetical protein